MDDEGGSPGNDRKRPKMLLNYLLVFTFHWILNLNIPLSCPSSSSLSVLLSFSASLSVSWLPGPGLCGGRDSAFIR